MTETITLARPEWNGDELRLAGFLLGYVSKRGFYGLYRAIVMTGCVSDPDPYFATKEDARSSVERRVLAQLGVSS